MQLNAWKEWPKLAAQLHNIIHKPLSKKLNQYSGYMK